MQKILFKESFEEIRKKVNLKDLLQYYGLESPSYTSHILCPFFDEDTPSLRIYNPTRETSSFYCFGCGKSGTILNFVMLYENCSGLQALKLLSERFNVPLQTIEQTDKLVSRIENIIKPKENKESKSNTLELNELKKLFDSLPEEEVPYLKTKKIKHFGTKSFKNNLVIPIHDINKNFKGIQLIKPNGEKKNSSKVYNRGYFFQLGNDPKIGQISFLVEGYATGASVHEATGATVFVVFTGQNLENVYKILKKKYYFSELICAADNDRSGHDHKLKAIYPEEKDWDFNDVACAYGLDKVKEILLKTKKEK